MMIMLSIPITLSSPHGSDTSVPPPFAKQI
jgi:hypothetical protein